MRESYAHRPSHPSIDRTRLLSGGVVLLLHGLVAIALLVHYQAVRQSAPPDRPLLLLKLKPDRPVREVTPVTPTRTIAPPSAILTSPLFTLSPSERHPAAIPEPITPGAPGLSAPAAPPKPGDLFTDEKKEEFKRFFKQQAAEDRRENAKAASGGRGCNVFRKPGEENVPDLNASNGITKNFVPAFGVGVHPAEEGDKVYAAPCN